MSSGPQLSLFGGPPPAQPAPTAPAAPAPPPPAPAVAAPPPVAPPSTVAPPTVIATPLVGTAPAPLATLPLPGLDGTNPLGFLAALGVLRLVDAAAPGAVRLGWAAPAWHAELVGPADLCGEVDALITHLVSQLTVLRGAAPLDLRWWQAGKAEKADESDEPEGEVGGDDGAGGAPDGFKPQQTLRMPPALFAAAAGGLMDGGDRLALDLLCGRGSEGGLQTAEGGAWWWPRGGLVDDKARLSGAPLQFTTGQQQFLRFADQLIAGVGAADLREALAGPWARGSTTDAARRKQPLPTWGWDPVDNREHALRGWNPTNKAKSPKIGVPGADLLALWALSLLPIFADPRGEGQSPVVRYRKNDGRMCWGLWRRPLGVDAVRSALQVQGLWELGGEEAAARGFGLRLLCKIGEVGQGGQRVMGPPQRR
ncbi:MAG: hypothetical protein RL071_3372 [Pseudomonadota bacterium]